MFSFLTQCISLTLSFARFISVPAGNTPSSRGFLELTLLIDDISEADWLGGSYGGH